jgi:hypothetical protein
MNKLKKIGTVIAVFLLDVIIKIGQWISMGYRWLTRKIWG